MTSGEIEPLSGAGQSPHGHPFHEARPPARGSQAMTGLGASPRAPGWSRHAVQPGPGTGTLPPTKRWAAFPAPTSACLLPAPLACQDRSWQGGVCRHEPWHLFICSLAPTLCKHLWVTSSGEGGSCFFSSELPGKRPHWALGSGPCDRDGHPSRVCSRRLIGKSEDLDCRTRDKRVQ